MPLRESASCANKEDSAGPSRLFLWTLVVLGPVAWATPSTLAQSSSQDTTREDVRPQTEYTDNPSMKAKKEIASNETAENKLGAQLVFRRLVRQPHYVSLHTWVVERDGGKQAGLPALQKH